ncbi:MAG: ABC transporter permease [Longimicrobiales bacterium]
MESLIRDLRYGLRALRKNPASSLIAVFALSFGIGLTTLMFSIVYGALLRGLPFESPDELVRILRAMPSTGATDVGASIHDFADWREQQSVFDDLGAVATGVANLGGLADPPERLDGAWLSASSFEIIGLAPALGRVFTEDEDRPGARNVMLIGWKVWQNRFGADAGVIGRTVRVNGEETTIIGVMPDGFGFPSAQNAWLPLRLDALATPRGEGRAVRVFGRLRDGVTIDAANSELAVIGERIARAWPEANEGIETRVEAYTANVLGAEERVTLWTMFGAVVFVLLIACANVANVLIGRAIVRAREVGVRTALGASRRQIAFQFLGEALVLALAGAAAGTALAAIGLRLFNAAIEGTRPPFWLVFQLDAPVLLCAIAATVVAALASGAIPALQAAGANTQEILKDESRGASSFRMGRLSRALVGLEMALSVGLLVGAGLMIRSVVNVYRFDLGFEEEDIFHARLMLPPIEYPDSATRIRFVDELRSGLGAIAGVESATIATGAPGLGSGGSSFVIEGRTDPDAQNPPFAAHVLVSPGYFEVFSSGVTKGRDFSDGDRAGSLPVAIVDEPFERRHFPDGTAIGRRIRLGRSSDEGTWLTIVGVVPDLFAGGLDDDRPEAIYRPIAQAGPTGLALVLRARGAGAAITPDVRDVLARLDPDIPIFTAGTLRDVIEQDNWVYGVFGALFMSFGAAALFLASVGLYGVMSFAVSRRTRELGVRMAMGARPIDVLRLVMRQGMTQSLIGLAAGTVLALAVAHLIRAALFNVQPRDPLVFVVIVLTLLSTALLACWIPARRATRIDALEALRYE